LCNLFIDVTEGNNTTVAQTQQTIQEAEPVVYRATIHWAALLGPAMLLVIGGVSVRSKPIPALVLIGLAILWGIFSIYNLRLSEFTMTAKKLTIRIGFPFKRFYEFPYSRISGVDLHQPALGMMLNFGKIIIMQTNGKGVVFRMVAGPMDFITRLRQELDRCRKENDPDKATGVAT